MEYQHPRRLPTYILSLESERKRREHAVLQFDGVPMAQPQIFDAVNAHADDFDFRLYRDLSRNKWGDMDVFKPGAFGCYLTHANCWKTVSEGAYECSLIVEDDAVLHKKHFDDLLRSKLPKSFDVVFLNKGVTRLVPLLDSSFPREAQDFLKLNDVVMNLLSMNRFTNEYNPGSYGYLISRDGANKLLNIMKRDKICMGVDYAILFASLDTQDINQISGMKECPSYLQVYLDNLKDDGHFSTRRFRDTLNSYVWSREPVLTHSKSFTSSLKHKKFLSFSVFD
ncbi:MAG: glycosyltransferase family 25 protein [Halioglobus sp.]